MAETPRRFIRVDHELWSRAGARAREDGYTLSGLIREWLTQYADGNQPSAPVDPATMDTLRDSVTGLITATEHLARHHR